VAVGGLASSFRGSGGGGGGFGSGAGSRSGSGGAHQGSLSASQSVYGTPAVSGNRINADALYDHPFQSDEDEASSGRKRARLPMGIRRIEHVEQAVIMTSTAEIEAQEQGAEDESDSDAESESLWVDDPNAGQRGTEIVDDDGVWEHAKKEGKVKIKKEENDTGDLMDVDFKAPDSPEQKKKRIFQKAKQKKRVAVKDPEEDLISEDLERMLQLFSIQANEVDKGDGLESLAASALEGHMFLFQFPSVLPPLKAQVSHRIKDEPNDDDPFTSDAPAAGKSSISIDLTKEADKADEGGDNQDTEEASAPVAGFVGNLVVRKSGKVELNWGGLTLNLTPGTQAEFLQTAAILEDADTKPGKGDIAGTAYGMGKIEGSFTLAPVWGEEEDWIVDPEELRIPE
jgi:DNA-directed RNA polymerase III subunit RPC4